MNYYPIIIPIQQTRTVECIAVEGKKYCELSNVTPTTPQELGFTLLVVTGLLIWVFGSVLGTVWLIEKMGIDDSWGVILGFVIMLLIPALILLL